MTERFSSIHIQQFQVLGATKDDACSAEIRIWSVSQIAAMAKVNTIWQCNTISFASKFKLYKSLVTLILLYGCVTRTLLADSEKKKEPEFRNQVPEESSPHLLLGAQDQRLGAEQDQLP